MTPDGRPELRPIIYAGERWPAGAVARAECPPHASSGHHAPEADCSCGLYAVDGLDRLPAVTGRDVTVIGSVSMWGTLIEHESGLRAEFAYPDRLRLVCGMCWHAGAFSPDVVGVSTTSRGTLLALCDRHARGATASEPGPVELERELLSAYGGRSAAGGRRERGGGRVEPSDPARPAIVGAHVSGVGRDGRPVLRRVPGVDGARVGRAVNRDRAR